MKNTNNPNSEIVFVEQHAYPYAYGTFYLSKNNDDSDDYVFSYQNVAQRTEIYSSKLKELELHQILASLEQSYPEGPFGAKESDFYRVNTSSYHIEFYRDGNNDDKDDNNDRNLKFVDTRKCEKEKLTNIIRECLLKNGKIRHKNTYKNTDINKPLNGVEKMSIPIKNNKTNIELFQDVEEWGKVRGLTNATPQVQYQRVLSEIVEIHDAMVKNDVEEIEDAIGDSIVTLINLAKTFGMLASDCLYSAYNVIECRKGITKNGDFIRYAKLTKEEQEYCDKMQGNPGLDHFDKELLKDGKITPDLFVPCSSAGTLVDIFK